MGSETPAEGLPASASSEAGPVAPAHAPEGSDRPRGGLGDAGVVHVDAGHAEGHGHGGFWALALGALGVVYGDIGTSPLYALRETINAAMSGHLVHSPDAPATVIAVPHEIVIGVLSLILWSLLLVVTVKYVVILLRADNNGEGGTLTLVALAQRALGYGRGTILFLGMAGAALFYVDSVITPAISVLSAVGGLKLVTPAFEPYVI